MKHLLTILALVLLPALSAQAQSVEQLNARIDSLSEALTKVDTNLHFTILNQHLENTRFDLSLMSQEIQGSVSSYLIASLQNCLIKEYVAMHRRLYFAQEMRYDGIKKRIEQLIENAFVIATVYNFNEQELSVIKSNFETIEAAKNSVEKALKLYADTLGV